MSAAKKRKPKYPTRAYAFWEEDEGNENGGYASFYDAEPSGEVAPGESKVVAVYELIGFVTIERDKPTPPTTTTSQLRHKP